MKFWFLLLMSFPLVGCYVLWHKDDSRDSIFAEKWTYEYYPEWGIRRVVGESLFQNGKSFSEQDVVFLLNNESFCYNLVTGIRGFYAERLFVNEYGELSLECIGLENNPFFYEDNGYFIYVLNDKARTRLEYKREKSFYRVTYRGNKIDLNVTQQKKDSLYEFTLPINESVYSLTLRTDSKDLENCEPLELASSILPLESPGYKKLREQEASLRIGK